MAERTPVYHPFEALMLMWCRDEEAAGRELPREAVSFRERVGPWRAGQPRPRRVSAYRAATMTPEAN